MNLQPLGRFEWEKVLRSSSLRSTAKLVGLMAATYGNRAGDKIHPGEQRLAEACGITTRSVRDALRDLRAAGLVERVFCGGSAGRRSLADEYRLTVPAGTGTPEPRSGDAEAEYTGTPEPDTGTPEAGSRTPEADDTNTGTWFRPPDHHHTIHQNSASLSAEQLVTGALGVNEREAMEFIEHIGYEHCPNNLKAWLRTVIKNGDLADIWQDYQDSRTPPPVQGHDVPWCGQCDPAGQYNPSARQVEYEGGRWGMCPRCSRAANQPPPPAPPPPDPWGAT